MIKRYLDNRYMAPEGDQGGAGGDAGNTGDAGKADAAGDAAGKTDAVKTDAGKTDVVKADWPETWRALASDDPKVQQRLARYQSPKAAIEAMIHAQNKISSGELLPKLGKNATDAELKEYREALGIPLKALDYDLTDLKISDETKKEKLAKFLEHAHNTHQTPEQVKGNLKFMFSRDAEMRAEAGERDKQFKAESEEALRAEWGAGYKLHNNMIHGLLDGLTDQKTKNELLEARLPDGRMVGSSPELMRFLAGLALVNNPAATVVPAGGANPAKSINEEIAKIEKMMREDRVGYNKNEKIQADYRKLIEAQQKLEARA